MVDPVYIQGNYYAPGDWHDGEEDEADPFEVCSSRSERKTKGDKKKMPTNELATRTPIRDIELMAKPIVDSKLFGIKSTAEAITLMLVAESEGRHPVTAIMDYDIIQGKPAKKTKAMLRDFIKGGGSVKWHQRDDKVADATFIHPQGGEVRVAWTIEKATAIGLTKKDNWKNYQREMLSARCLNEGIRTVYPGATGLLYSPEEVADFDPEPRNVTPKSEAIPTPSPAQEKPTAGTTDANSVVIDAEIVDDTPPPPPDPPKTGPTDRMNGPESWTYGQARAFHSKCGSHKMPRPDIEQYIFQNTGEEDWIGNKFPGVNEISTKLLKDSCFQRLMEGIDKMHGDKYKDSPFE